MLPVNYFWELKIDSNSEQPGVQLHSIRYLTLNPEHESVLALRSIKLKMGISHKYVSIKIVYFTKIFQALTPKYARNNQKT